MCEPQDIPVGDQRNHKRREYTRNFPLMTGGVGIKKFLKKFLGLFDRGVFIEMKAPDRPLGGCAISGLEASAGNRQYGRPHACAPSRRARST